MGGPRSEVGGINYRAVLPRLKSARQCREVTYPYYITSNRRIFLLSLLYNRSIRMVVKLNAIVRSVFNLTLIFSFAVS